MRSLKALYRISLLAAAFVGAGNSQASEITFPVQNPPTNKYMAIDGDAIYHTVHYSNKVKLKVTSGEVFAVTNREIIVARRAITVEIQPQPTSGWSADKDTWTETRDFRQQNTDYSQSNNPVGYLGTNYDMVTFKNDDNQDPPDEEPIYQIEKITPYVRVADLQVDSLNQNPYGGVSGTDDEDDKEDTDEGVKIVGYNVQSYSPNSSKPGWADFSAAPASHPTFATMHLFLQSFPSDTQVRFQYSGSNPSQITQDNEGNWLLPAQGCFRVWTKNVYQPRSLNNYIQPNTIYSFDQLANMQAKVADGHFVFYIEAVKMATSLADNQVTVEVKTPGSSWMPLDTVRFSSFDIEGYRRGTINNPGAKVPKDGSEYGQETVMMENADSEENPTQPDYATPIVDPANDDDLVKVVLRWPKNLKVNGGKLELRHTGMEVDATKTSNSDKYKEIGPSRLNFYKPDGTKLTSADLKIDNLGSPGNGYLAQILNTGELTLFIEGGEKFGYLGPDVIPNGGGVSEYIQASKKMGGAMLNFEFTYNGVTSRSRLLVYRGGFLLFHQPSGQPGVVGPLEFRDGKGRVTNEKTDYGNVLYTWSAKSGLLSGADYDKSGGNGHIPPGWRIIYERIDFSDSQRDRFSGSGQNRKIMQGGYVRWKQDDEANPAARYTTNFLYDASKAKDYGIGEPDTVRFKFQTEAIPPTSPAGRTDIQIHPDGKKNGTAGCIGIQTYDNCKEVQKALRRYHGLKLKVELQ